MTDEPQSPMTPRASSAGRAGPRISELQSPDEAPPEFRPMLDEYWKSFDARIMKRAKSLAAKDSQQVTAVLVAQAAQEFAPGCPCKERPWWRGLSWPLSLSGVTLVAAVLAALFGGFALYGPSADKTQAAFLDIAKVFAGAVVGSAAGAAVASKHE